ncbi:MAG TPA: protein kinase [Vicinamibacterales bacterium]|nr:protein kinase [Vicinamibacterales bacterium]
MTLAAGSRLGSYEILGAIGAGGMGEVYRARDTKLNREIAIKILPEAFVGDPDRHARFKREAQVLASINHQHIAAIYGFEDSGRSHALVLELVEGPTLAERIAQGAIPLDEALAIAKQIADALEAAHERGIIHRDLKPANIKLRLDGTVKVLDFGLAKELEPPSTMSPGQTSPTITTPALMTNAGMILGTAAYMAPEQAKGKAADRRSDMWAFGCVLYEMLTGRRPFDGEDVSDTMAAVLRAEPDWAALPAGMPPGVAVLLRRCLEKDRRARIVDAGAALFVLREFASLAPASAETTRDRPHSWRHTALYAIATLALVCAAVAAAAFVLRSPPPRVARFALGTTSSAPLAISQLGVDVAVSPDGTRVVYRAGNPALLYAREIGRLEATPLAGTENVSDPFFSPDGRWIAFWQGGFLKKVSIQGGSSLTIAAAQATRGATWGRNNTIVFATVAGMLFTVPAAGGTAVPLPLNAGYREGTYEARRWPQFLPDGRHVLTTRGSATDQYTVTVVDLQTAQERDLFAGSCARYVSSGHLVYNLGGALRAVRFDAASLDASPDSVPVVERVIAKGSGAADFDVSEEGSLVYVTGAGLFGGAQQVISLLDRQGRVSPLDGIPTGSYRDVRFSPDGRRVALATFDDVWIYDVVRATLSRLTTNPAPDRSPLWSRDGQRILFTSVRANYPELYSISADGTGTEERLFGRLKNDVDLRANGWSADGHHLLFTEVTVSVQCAIGDLVADKPSEATLLVQDQFCSDFAAVSPDGRWLAYDSSVSGRVEVYLQRYPNLGARQQVSTTGARLPLWSANGRELYFSSLDARQILSVSVDAGSPPVVGRPRVVFEGEFLAPQTGFHPYDVGPDGRFVIVRPAGDRTNAAAVPNLVLVQHWLEELKRLAPAK